MNSTPTSESPMIYWHRELPPSGAEPMAEHVVEAVSARVPDTTVHREELWDQCRVELATNVRQRLHDEIRRLGGRYAHVLDESIETRHDACSGEAWLHGRFTYMLYR